MNDDRFKFRAPHFKNNEFDGFVYFEAGYDCKKPSDHGYLGRREQCTGLKDKNGTLVFEGDIIFLNGKKRQVIWRDEDCAFFFSDIKEVYYQPIFPDFYRMTDDFEVIGNIHKNPELVND